MPSRILFCLPILLGYVTNALAAAPEGIPRSLARERAAATSDIRYRLNFNLTRHAAATEGSEELRFILKSPQNVLLDYRDGTVKSMSVNGASEPTALDNGHLLLPADALRTGENVVEIEFTSNVATANKPITRFEDRDDGSEYIYTLFVPMDASMAFPCFDQPDLKAKFTLNLTHPTIWQAVSNTNGQMFIAASAISETRFAETKPIPTYLFAFAAGPFKKIEHAGLPGLYVRQSQLARAESEALEVQQTAARGIEFLSDFFAQPFPFPKYDMVLIPGLAYGGMEHAGATFLREESVLFRTAPTHTDRIGRQLLVLHELTHQWFGDLVTMRWFDDLWLKEGFAQYMAYHTLAALQPQDNIWKRFYEAIKPGAYAIDSTKGTTPIYQDIPNLKDAKSAYGAIVYSKAPAVLKQLAFVLGAEHFRDGLRLYLKEHAYGNAEWSDLVHAFERVSGQQLEHWAEMWIRHRGMPQVDVDWSCADGKINHFALRQKDVLGEGGVWPIALQIALNFADDFGTVAPARFDQPTTELRGLAGMTCPRYVFANNEDYAYGRFLLDERSRNFVMHHRFIVHTVAASSQTFPPPPLGSGLFQTTLLWGSLWDAVREAQLAPRDYIALARTHLPVQTDESLTQSIVGRAIGALHHYVSDATRAELAPPLEKLAADKMVHANDQGLRIIWFRGLRGVAETSSGRDQLKQLLAGKLAVPGVELRPLDRWNMVTSLIALRDPDSDAIFAHERERDHTGDGQKYAWIAEAARPDAATKKNYFNEYLHNPARQEDWISQSLGAFNYWNQAELTAPYLKPALDALPQIKRERKIFFLVAWLDAFIGGQQSAAAQTVVYDFLKSAQPEEDLRLKILQAVDELDRTVKVRQRFP